MDKIELRVEGMTCGGCVSSVQKALSSHNGVSNASADLDTGMVSISFDSNLIQKPALKKAILDAGFEVAADA